MTDSVVFPETAGSRGNGRTPSFGAAHGSASAYRRSLTVAAVMRTPEASARLSEAGAGLTGIEFKTYVGHPVDVTASLDIVAGADILVLDVDPRSSGEVAQLQRLVNERSPGVPIIVAVPEVTLEDVRHLMRLGVADVVPQPISRVDLKGALDYAAQVRTGRRDTAAPRGRVVTFLKAGGGVGATTLAVQSACLLAAPNHGRVCLLDLDVQFGAAALHLDLDDRVGLGDLLEAPERLDAELLGSVMSRHESGVDLLAAPRDPAALEAMTPEVVMACLDRARGAYDTVVLDMPALWVPWSVAAVRSSDLVVLVAQLTVAGVRQAKRQLDVLQARGLGDVPLRLVLNRFERRWRSRVSREEAEKALSRKVDYLVADDPRTVREAVNRGVVLSEIKRNARVVRDVQAIAADIERGPRVAAER